MQLLFRLSPGLAPTGHAQAYMVAPSNPLCSCFQCDGLYCFSTAFTAAARTRMSSEGTPIQGHLAVECRPAHSVRRKYTCCASSCLTLAWSPHAPVKSSGLRRNCRSRHSTCPIEVEEPDHNVSQLKGHVAAKVRCGSWRHLSVPRIHAHSLGLAHGRPLAELL
jgi:hypothetical protein